MKVHVIKLQTIYDYCLKDKNAKIGLETWARIVSEVNWDKPSDILKTFGYADILGKGCERIVFNIGGNKHRMICSYYFGKKLIHLYINWIGNHVEYDNLCKLNQQFTIENY